MAEGAPPRDARTNEPAPGSQPPPLDAIRVKGPGAKGLNKPAILAVAGGGIAIVLVLASGAFSGDPARKPAETKPMMSDPARPEMARGAIRELPATYTEAAAREAASAPALPPRLGPPLPGDVAAFAPRDPQLRGYSGDGEPPHHGPSWSEPEPGYAQPAPPNPASQEDDDAKRAGLFFALRTAPQQGQATAPESEDQRPSAALTAFAPETSGPAASADTRQGTLFPGSVIPASLITDLNSEAAGPVIAQVTQAIHDSATGRTLLIPQGARLVGDYKSSTRYGQNRVAIIWSRLIMPDGFEIRLDEIASDPAGSAGVSGDVDEHWPDIFGAAAVGTLINIGVATTEDPQLTYGGLGGTARDPVDAAIADGVQRSASSVTNRIVDRGLAIPPTIRVQAGTRISVIVTRRMHLGP